MVTGAGRAAVLRARRIARTLSEEQVFHQQEGVRRLMRVMGIEALGPKPRTTKRAPGHKICPYLLRDLTIDRPSGGVTTTPGGRTIIGLQPGAEVLSPPSWPGRLRNPRPAPPPDSVGGSAIVLIQVNNSPVTLCRTRSASASGL